jgi:two-component system alkaline phosphatase synthesis response regulator PhoP
MSGERLLVVEDEAHLREVIADNLELEGYAVATVDNGLDALERARGERPDLMLLDVMLPGLNGFEVCKRLREARDDTPILFLTARSGDDDRVRGLELGGDDFLGKPFDLRELILRVKAILRRTQWYRAGTKGGDELVLGTSRVDFKRFVATVDGQELVLSQKEAMILRYLWERSGEVVDRAEILDRCWGYEAFPTTRTIDNFIVRLRRVLEPDARNPRYIHTVRGVGYRLTP